MLQENVGQWPGEEQRLKDPDVGPRGGALGNRAESRQKGG